MNQLKFTKDNTRGFSAEDIIDLNRALEILLQGRTDEALARHYSDKLSNAWCMGGGDNTVAIIVARALAVKR